MIDTVKNFEISFIHSYNSIVQDFMVGYSKETNI